MNYDEKRQERLSLQSEVELKKLEENLIRTRQKLLRALGVLSRHKATLEKKQEKGAEPGATQERVDKKQAQIDAARPSRAANHSDRPAATAGQNRRSGFPDTFP